MMRGMQARRPGPGLRTKAPWGSMRRPAPALTRQDLVQAMGLGYDPFVTAFSEGDPTGSFADIFVDPEPSLLDRLQRLGPTLVVADYGMGKTATRLALEYLLRTDAGRPAPLCVTYTPRVQDSASLGGRELLVQHYKAMAAAAAIDIVVQFIERIDDAPSELTVAQRQALARQVRALPLRFKQRFRSAAQNPPSAGAIWGGSQALTGIRPTVRYVAVTPRWRELVGWIAGHCGSPTLAQPWEQTREDARTLGFAASFLLVDAVDEGTPEPTAQYRLVEPLLAEASTLAERHCFLKCFLPVVDLSQLDHGRNDKNSLTDDIEIATIDRATSQDLIAIVHERLQAASTSPAAFLSLDVFARGDIPESIEERLAQLAGGSPRRMMELVSAFLDFCASLEVGHGDRRERPHIRQEEWKRFLASLEAGPGSGVP